ncbi:MAG: hypothetical protein OXT03_05595, partial [Alphaproteobacteria bacterium]|nr:hypothetical protein [Alphaproteobacteria bacterium]
KAVQAAIEEERFVEQHVKDTKTLDDTSEKYEEKAKHIRCFAYGLIIFLFFLILFLIYCVLGFICLSEFDYFLGGSNYCNENIDLTKSFFTLWPRFLIIVIIISPVIWL